MAVKYSLAAYIMTTFRLLLMKMSHYFVVTFVVDVVVVVVITIESKSLDLLYNANISKS